MPRLQRRSFAEPEETRRFPHGTVRTVALDETVFGEYRMKPGCNGGFRQRLSRAVRCGQAMVAASRSRGLDIRVGCHTGEVELVQNAARGVAVHAAARVMGLAGAGEVFVSWTTRDLLAGSGISVETTGTHELKGLDGPREIFRVL